MRPQSFTQCDLEALSGMAELFNELLETGAINKVEHRALLETAWNDAAHDRAVARSRQGAIHFSTPTATSEKEPYMNPRSIIESIEQNRAVMEAGIKRLGGLSPGFPSATPDSTDAASLLAHTAHAHITGTAEVLHELAQAEAETRRAFQTAGSHPTPAVIDGEAVVIAEEKPSK